MRDLAARLREVVGRRVTTAETEASHETLPADAAEALGATSIGPSCLMIDRRFDGSASHGRWRVDEYAPRGEMRIGWLDRRCAGVSDWARRPIFFDIETTGLSGGAGMIAFLVGCGWFDDEGFVVRQFLLTGPAGEPTLLAALADVVNDASLLVTYNGRTFDVPVMDLRWAFHRGRGPLAEMPHCDMLPPARRFWGRRESCSLTALERSVLAFHRLDDVPGLEIPARYFQFLRTGDARAIAGVLDHNRHDLISLAAITTHALRLIDEGPLFCREHDEQLALGKIYEHAARQASGEWDRRARECYELAAASPDADVRDEALARHAEQHRRAGRHDEAARIWRRLAELDGALEGRSAGASPYRRRAIEALAIHHEHRAKDLAEAKAYAERLDESGAPVAARHAARHRLDRLERKLRARGLLGLGGLGS